MNREKARLALARLDGKHDPSNAAIIAECIRVELAEARARYDSAIEAEERVAKMLREEFIYAAVTEPFKFDDVIDFSRWSVTMKYPTSAAFRVCEVD
jgi:hypothetical protein